MNLRKFFKDNNAWVDPHANNVAINLKFDAVLNKVTNEATVGSATLALPSGFSVSLDPITGLPGFNPRKTGKYIQFNYTANNIPYIHPNATVTREFWTVPSSADHGNFFSLDRYGSNYDLGVQDLRSLRIIRTITNQTTVVIDRSYGVGEFPINEINHFAFAHDGATARNYCFINGKLLPVFNWSFPNNGNHMTIGCSSWNNPGMFLAAHIVGVRFTPVVRWTSDFDPPPVPF